MTTDNILEIALRAIRLQDHSWSGLVAEAALEHDWDDLVALCENDELDYWLRREIAEVH